MTFARARRGSPFLLACGVALATLSALGATRQPAHAPGPPVPSLPVAWFPQASPLDGTQWLAFGIQADRRFRLVPEATLSALGRYLRPWENHTPEWRSFVSGRFGAPRWEIPSLVWRIPGVAEPVDLPVAKARPCPRWQAPRALTVLRYGGESERMPLFDCDGGIAPDVVDRLSALARAPATPRPELPLPAEASAVRPGEWIEGLHLLDPRLIWVLGKLQAAFPGRAVVIMSGYRPDAHTSYHRHGKALDLYVQGVDNADVFRVCRTLRDVGCGYYPNNVFVHVDVRPYGTRNVGWVDTSRPGEPSRYVDGWPGVLDAGAGWRGGD